MLRRPKLSAFRAAFLFAAAAGILSPAGAQDQGHVQPIFARARVFPEIGPGVAALKRDSAGRYYILAAPANSIAIYAADGKPAGKIPNANSHGAKIVYADDIDLDAGGRIFVSDRGANAIKVFNPDGSLEATISVAAPGSLVALSGNEFAVAALRSELLVSIFDLHAKLVRAFGDVSGAPVAAGGDTSALLQRGRVYGDPAGHIYFAFANSPEPAIRKYDRYGFAAYEISLPSPESATPEEAKSWVSITIEKSRGARREKPLIGAVAGDPETLEMWAAMEDEIFEFDKDGARRAAYRTATADGVRIEPDAILIEPNRILVADDPLGIFDFARPDK